VIFWGVQTVVIVGMIDIMILYVKGGKPGNMADRVGADTGTMAR
jgi:hypothetical protein